MCFVEIYIMSSMTESLLLHAQTLVSTGECSASIDTLRVVIAQCASDMKNCEEKGRGEVVADYFNAYRTARRMRSTASHLLSTLLLQRAGRRKQERHDSCRRMRAQADIDDHDDYCCNEDEDECEADALLRTKLGYHLRLSTMAFGYPPCGCLSSCSSKFKSSLPSPVLDHDDSRKLKALSSIILDSSSAMFQRTTIIDNVLPPLILFQKLQHAFRPKSKYWSEFYHHETNIFASHNIPLPPTNTSRNCSTASSSPPSSSSSMLDQHLRQSKSLFEQVAIIIQQQLIQYFPDIIHATSVEIWCHARSQDEGHRLHYDMDEILLWLERRRKQKPQQEQSRKRSKIHLPLPVVNEVAGQITTTTPASGESPSSSLLLVKSNQLVKNDDTENDTDGISCPIISCVLTLSVPNSTKCQTCGESSNCAPTIICDQSILKRRNRQSCCTATMSSNAGYLCFPKVNRLLAFEGSLLHGVMPGIPTLRHQSGSLSSMPNNNDDDSYDDEDDGKSYHDKQRITMMLGFWKNVCKTKSTIIGDHETSSSPFGPNVPYATQKGSWKEDFKPISISNKDLDGIMKSCNATSNKSASDLVVIDPLWTPIHTGSTIEEEEQKKISDNTIGECSFCNGNSSSRFFLQSNSPCEIDNEVLCGV